MPLSRRRGLSTAPSTPPTAGAALYAPTCLVAACLAATRVNAFCAARPALRWRSLSLGHRRCRGRRRRLLLPEARSARVHTLGAARPRSRDSWSVRRPPRRIDGVLAQGVMEFLVADPAVSIHVERRKEAVEIVLLRSDARLSDHLLKLLTSQPTVVVHIRIAKEVDDAP